MGDMADLFDEYGPDEDREDVTCKYCGEDDLEWAFTGKRWVLMNADGDIHVCARVASADDFDDLT